MATYREQAKDGIVQAIYNSIGGTPWINEVEIALAKLFAIMDQHIGSDPVLREILDKPQPPDDPLPF
jgi:hypothetical protein